MKQKVLFITQILEHKAACGIGQIGHSYAQALKNHSIYDFEIFYCDNLELIKQKIRNSKPNAVIYNYSPVSTPWIDDESLRSDEFSHIFQARFMHDINQYQVDTYKIEDNYGWKFNFSSDVNLKGNQYVFPVNRILPNPPIISYLEKLKPVIGFHGFGFSWKGIHRIAEQVIKEFDEAVIKLHMPFAYYGDSNGEQAFQRIEEVKSIIKHKPGIELIATHEILEPDEIVNWLGQNTINCYFYDYLEGRCPSSSLDFAIAAKRPIAVTRSYQMRHVWNLTPSILIEENSLKTIIANGIRPLEPLYSLYSKESVCDDFSRGLKDKI